MASQYVLGYRFFMGGGGSAPNVDIVEDEYGGAMLVGCGHAVYAYRFPNGTTLGFMGWANPENVRELAGSNTTRHHYRKLAVEPKASFIIEGTGEQAAPKRDGFDPERWSRYLWQCEREDVPLTDVDE